MEFKDLFEQFNTEGKLSLPNGTVNLTIFLNCLYILKCDYEQDKRAQTFFRIILH